MLTQNVRVARNDWKAGQGGQWMTQFSVTLTNALALFVP